MTSAYVNCEIEDRIATITFYHPAHNSMPGSQLKKLTEAIQGLEEETNVSVIILRSGGDRTFCAGASFDELIAISNPEEGKVFFSGFANVINACRKSSKIIIGRIQGKAVGGGVGIISACDYSIASKYAAFRLSELELGIGPFVIGPAVKRKVGNKLFSTLSITPGEWRTAEWALKNGLYDQVHDNNEELDKAVNSFAHELSGYNPEALAALKKVFWEGTEHWDSLLAERAIMSGKLVLSEYTRNALQAIKNKAS